MHKDQFLAIACKVCHIQYVVSVFMYIISESSSRCSFNRKSSFLSIWPAYVSSCVLMCLLCFCLYTVAQLMIMFDVSDGIYWPHSFRILIKKLVFFSSLPKIYSRGNNCLVHSYFCIRINLDLNTAYNASKMYFLLLFYVVPPLLHRLSCSFCFSDIWINRHSHIPT